MRDKHTDAYLLEKASHLLTWWHYYLLIGEEPPDRILETMANLSYELERYLKP